MDLSRRGAVITLLAALGLAVTAYVGLFVSGVPTIFSPFPVLAVIPALMLFPGPPLDYVVVVIPCLLFLLWNPQLMRRNGKYREELIFFSRYSRSSIFCGELALGITVPGPAIHGCHLLNKCCMDWFSGHCVSPLLEKHSCVCH
jgi:hypothetical protein